jgi:hypothetical protein
LNARPVFQLALHQEIQFIKRIAEHEYDMLLDVVGILLATLNMNIHTIGNSVGDRIDVIKSIAV